MTADPRTVTVNGTELAYDEAGAGPAVVFTHAGLADRRMWEHQFTALADDHRVIRWDSRGYGGSADASGDVDHHADLLGLLDALAVERAALVGCSQGGGFSIDVALAAPDRVGALVPIASGLSGHPWPEEMIDSIRAEILRWVPADRLRVYGEQRGEPVRDEDLAAMAVAQARAWVAGPGRDPAEVDPAVWQAALTMLENVFRRLWSGPPTSDVPADPPAAGRLGEVRAPTLVINGLADQPALQEVSDLLVTGIPGARRLDLPDTGHLPPLERPAETTAALRDFLAAVYS